MSDRVTLVPRDGVSEISDVEGVTGDRFVTLTEQEIAHLRAWQGRLAIQLGDLFDVRGGQSSTIHVLGTAPHVNGIGSAMAAGTIIVDGDAGERVAAGMSGGHVDIRGGVGHDGGVAMSGGSLHVRTDAGDRLGGAPPGARRGMTGGEIVVHGRTGDDAGALCRRGLIAIGGDTGSDAARGMIAGSLVVIGRTGDGAGRFNKRGSLVAIGGIEVPSTYRYACTYRPPHLRLMFRHLQQTYGLHVDAVVMDGRYRRFCGDLLDPGKGEILVYDAT